MLDFSKPVRTKSGLPARIICQDAAKELPLIALLEDRPGHEAIETYTLTGKYYPTEVPSSWDLENIPDEVWVNVYFTEDMGYFIGVNRFSTKEAAESKAVDTYNIGVVTGYRATVKVEG